MSLSNPLYHYKSHPNAKFEQPRYGDAGWDLCCVEDVRIPAFGSPLYDHSTTPSTRLTPHVVKIPTGIHLEIPHGYFGMIVDKSGVATKKQLRTLAGIIDETYRGEIIVVLANLSPNVASFKAGEKVAQIIFMPYHYDLTLVEAPNLEELSDTERGTGGFGSTGS